jgi:hypothetical protein
MFHLCVLCASAVNILSGLPVLFGPDFFLVPCPEFKGVGADFPDLVDIPVFDLEDQEPE